MSDLVERSRAHRSAVNELAAARDERIMRFAHLDPELQEILLTAGEMGLVTLDLGLDEDQAIATLQSNQHFQVLRSVVLRQRDDWIRNFARGMAMSPNLVDQREVDEKRGYFKGAVYYVQHLPRISQRRVAQKEE